SKLPYFCIRFLSLPIHKCCTLHQYFGSKSHPIINISVFQYVMKSGPSTKPCNSSTTASILATLSPKTTCFHQIKGLQALPPCASDDTVFTNLATNVDTNFTSYRIR